MKTCLHCSPRKSSPIEQWFHDQTEQIVRDLVKQFDIEGLAPALIIWSVNDDAVFPTWHRTLLGRLGIEYVTVRGGEEVNYLVFLDCDMNKFAEREIYWRDA